jgi:hypothetical protein
MLNTKLPFRTTIFYFILFFLVIFKSFGQVSGVVFRDFNGNGLRDLNDPLMPGIRVMVYDTLGNLCGSDTTSGSDAPNYMISTCGSGQVRVEFRFISGQSCTNGNLDMPSFSGNIHGSNIQFGSGNSNDIDFAIIDPHDYNSGANNALVYLPCYVHGDPLVTGGAAGLRDWFVGYPYNNSGSTAPTKKMNGQIIGATWGTAYSKYAKKIFTSALVKRHVGLGTLGTGGIYILTERATDFTAAPFYDLDANGFRTRASISAPSYGEGSSYSFLESGSSPRSTINFLGSMDPITGEPVGLGVIGTNPQRGLNANLDTSNYDPAAFDQVGKVGLGDIELSDDGEFLYVTNLYSRKIIRLRLNDIYNPTAVVSVTEFSIPSSILATNGKVRPWGLKFYRGKLYIGVTATGENAGETSDLIAFVLEVTDPNGAFTINAAPILSIPLNYTKGSSAGSSPTVFGGTTWQPWSNTTSLAQVFGSTVTMPQPILSNIEFTDRGELVAVFMDRAGNQFGGQQYLHLGMSSTLIYGTIGGDILIAGYDCNSGAYQLENNASYTSINNVTYTSLGESTSQGPGDGEFFYNENFSIHKETVMGGAAILKGDDKVFITTSDPLSLVSGGTMKLSVSTGSSSDRYQLYSEGITPNTTASLAKAIGLGDLELKTELAGIEIGNRVWFDKNKNGRQDAGEKGLPNVRVELIKNDTVIAFATTNSNGEYYFSSLEGTSTPSFVYNISKLVPLMTYKVRIPNTSGGEKQNSLLIYAPTNPNVASPENADQIDSDGIISGNLVETMIMDIEIPIYGMSNHSYDFGFFDVEHYSIGNKIWGDKNNNGVLDAGENPIADVSIILHQIVNGVATPIKNTTSNGQGLYLFTELPRGKYIVEIPSSAFSLSGPLYLHKSSTGNGPADLLNGPFENGTLNTAMRRVNSDKGQFNRYSGVFVGSVVSDTIMLGDNSPINEESGSDNNDRSTLDNRSILTIDFGFLLPNCQQLECKGSLNLSLDRDCQYLVTPSLVLNSPFTGPPYYVVVYDDRDNIIPGNLLTKDHIGKKIKVVVHEPAACGLNTCWSWIYVEDKFPPILTIPRDTSVLCVSSTLPSATGMATATDCGTVLIQWKDVLIKSKDKCTKDGDTLRIITRQWSAVDSKGNIALDSQTIYVISLSDTMIKEPSKTITLRCGQATDPEDIRRFLSLRDAYPYIIRGSNLYAIGSDPICNIAANYKDGPKLYSCGEFCTASYKFLRTWTLNNWCTGRTFTFTQIIKVVDETGPMINVSSTGTFTTNAWGCDTDLELPMAEVKDSCDIDASIVEILGPLGVKIERRGNKWFALGVPKGTNTFTYVAADCCSNRTQKNIQIIVQDRIGPVPVAKEFITLSLSSGNTGIKGLAILTPQNVDNGSYDNCSKIYMEVRREDGSPACSNLGLLWDHDNNGDTPSIPWNNNITYNGTTNGLGQNVPLHFQDNRYDNDNGQKAFFCCEDIGREVKVFLRVWDDGDMDGVFGSAGDNYNETWTTVKVEDKSTPNLTCKTPIITDCQSKISKVYIGLGWQPAALLDASIVPETGSVCGSEIDMEFMDQGTISSCNFTLPNQPLMRIYRLKSNIAVRCTQFITINPVAASPVLDYPINLIKWNKCTLTEAEVLANTPRATLASVDYDQGWGTEVEIGSDGKVLLFRPDFRNPGCNLYGRRINIEEFNSGGGCKKWIVKFEYIDWCNQSAKTIRTTTYKYDDNIAPKAVVKLRDTIEVSASSCRASFTTRPTGTDEGNGCINALSWTVTLINASTNIAATGTGASPTLNFGSLLPGKYRVVYSLKDACGNVDIKEGELVVIGKKPTPYCVNISSAVMKNGSVEVWARDFDKGSFSNCFTSQLYFTFDNWSPVISKLSRPHFFRANGEEVTTADTLVLYARGEIQKWNPTIVNGVLVGGTSGKAFGCKVGNGSTFPTSEQRMTVWDVNFQSDFCTVKLDLVDNNNGCGSSSLIRVSGSVSSQKEEKLSDVAITIESSLPEFPRQTKTNQDGVYSFENLPSGIDTKITANKKDDYLNGVNTLDLVHMQRHILGITKLDDPYRLIAADVDEDQFVKVSDLVELRKTILGLDTHLDESKSWKFLKPNATNPWPREEVIAHATLRENVNDANFVAIKMGDLDGNAVFNTKDRVIQPRNSLSEIYGDELYLKNGLTYEVPIYSKHGGLWFGFQAGLSTKDITIEKIEGNQIYFDQDHYAYPTKDIVSMSWASNQGNTVYSASPLFTITIKANKDGYLSKMLRLNNEILQSEAYLGDDMTQKGLTLEFRNNQATTFDVIQNEPNPWQDETIIQFNLPMEGNASLTLSSVDGRILHRRTIQGKKGLNAVVITDKDINEVKGIVNYNLEFNNQSLTKKMIVIK